MSEHIEALPDDKRLKILQASLAEFAEHGYLGASTNRIVQAAGISKGLLFHYFDSKKKLFLYVLDHTISHLMQKITQYSFSLSGDFFETVGQYAQIKLRIGIEEPQMYHILYDVYVNLPAEIKNELMERYEHILSDQRKSFVRTLDVSRLRDGVSAEAAANLITDFLDGYYQRSTERYKTMTPEELLSSIDDMKDDIMRYLNIIKRGIYRDEG